MLVPLMLWHKMEAVTRRQSPSDNYSALQPIMTTMMDTPMNPLIEF